MWDATPEQPYIREPGRYDSIRKKLSADGFNFVRDQLHALRDGFFSGTPFPPSQFPQFLRFPLVAGYAIGIESGWQRRQKIQLSETEILASVMSLDGLYSDNGLDLQMSTHFSMQQSIYRLGVAVGEQEISGNHGMTLLAILGQMFLKYPDPKVHQIMLPQMLNAMGLEKLTPLVPEYVRRWGHHVEYVQR